MEVTYLQSRAFHHQSRAESGKQAESRQLNGRCGETKLVEDAWQQKHRRIKLLNQNPNEGTSPCEARSFLTQKRPLPQSQPTFVPSVGSVVLLCAEWVVVSLFLVLLVERLLLDQGLGLVLVPEVDLVEPE